MILNQREERPTGVAEEAQSLWRPPSAADADERSAYVVVDDLEDDVTVLVANAWPRLDDLGRLRFPGDRLTLVIATTRFQAMADFDRQLSDTDAPDRPIRVGDVFRAQPRDVDSAEVDLKALSRSLDDDSIESEERRFQLFDVSADARDAAKQAMYAAAAPTVSADYANTVGLVRDERLLERGV